MRRGTGRGRRRLRHAQCSEDGQDRRPGQPLGDGGLAPAGRRHRSRHPRRPVGVDRAVRRDGEPQAGGPRSNRRVRAWVRFLDLPRHRQPGRRRGGQSGNPRVLEGNGEQRVAFSSAVLGGERGGILLAPDFEAAIAFVNDYAPEHLEILGRDPFGYLGRIVNAGEILLGENTPLPLGNFVLGPNAVLPTSGQARTCSPLSVFDFLKRSSVGYVTAAGYPELARHAQVLATYEGFDGHANAVSPLREKARSA